MENYLKRRSSKMWLRRIKAKHINYTKLQICNNFVHSHVNITKYMKLNWCQQWRWHILISPIKVSLENFLIITIFVILTHRSFLARKSWHFHNIRHIIFSWDWRRSHLTFRCMNTFSFHTSSCVVSRCSWCFELSR